MFKYITFIYVNKIIMTDKDEQLLLADLAARVPYGVKCNINFNQSIKTLSFELLNKFYDITITPYLRPMSSMTEEEMKELCNLCDFYVGYNDSDNFSHYGIEIISRYCVSDERFPESVINFNVLDWLNKKMFDYRGLIPKRLALEAKEYMYKTK